VKETKIQSKVYKWYWRLYRGK